MQKKIIEKAIAFARKLEVSANKNELCFIHGDYNPGNILFTGDIPTGLIDLDWSRKGLPLEDLAYTLMMFMRDYATKSFRFDEERFLELCSWYGLREADFPDLKKYLILYAFYDANLFRRLKALPNRELYYSYQKEMLDDFCLRFAEPE
ncbi:MAG: phosphotransferase [Patescibacteria group bacterium]|nr:phosphotransferase [Patescibacteria group bacterium]